MIFNHKPRSIYIAFEAFPRPRGAASHIASMLTALSHNFGPVLMLCLGYGDMPAYQVEGDIIIRRFKAYHPNMLRRAREFGAFVAECVAACRDSTELLVFRDPWGGCPALVEGLGIPAVFEVNALPSAELAYTYAAFADKRALQHKIEDLEYFCLDKCDGVLTVSPVTGNFLRGKGVAAEKITTVVNSAGEEFFLSSQDDLPDFLARGRWFGYVGGLHPWQGVEDAVEAFSLIRQDYADVKMAVITGANNQARKKLKKRIRKLGLTDQVRVHPPLAKKALAAALASLEFTLAPLRNTSRNVEQGCCPIKIIESMAAGTPVIASGLQCVKPLIDDGQNGVLIEPEARRSLAHAMMRLLDNPGFRNDLAAGAKTKAAQCFERKAIHDKLNQYFKNVVAGQG